MSRPKHFSHAYKPGLKERTRLALHGQFRKVQTKLHDLTYLMWECTLNCNLGCLHCGSDCRVDARHKDMPAKDFLAILDMIAPKVKTEKTMIVLTGGEPCLRPDLEAIGKEIYKRRFPWGMVSNGWALTEKKINGLMQSGMRSLTISLDGLEQSHDTFRGRKGSYRKALDAIRTAARTEGLVFDAVTCVNQKNISELPRIRDLLIEAGLKQWRLFNIFPRGRAAQYDWMELPDDQFRQVFDFIVQTRREGRIKASYSCEGFLGEYENTARDGYFFCRAGVNIAGILNNGDITGCTSMRDDYIQGNIYQDNFPDVWENRFQNMRDRGWLRTGICKDCKVFKHCQGSGLHLRDAKTGELMYCHLKKLCRAKSDQ